jgi:hypothetical protein
MPEPQEGQSQSPPAANLPLRADLMGYPSEEALVNAKRASDAEAKRLHDENEGLRNQLLTFYQAQANPRQDVKQRGTLDERLNESGIPATDIRELAREVVRGELEPLVRGVGARNSVLAQYPDYNKYEADVAQFVESDPNLKQTYGRMFQADPAGAFEYAFLKFGESRRRSVNPDNLSAEAQAHAGIPSSRNGEARRGNQNEEASVQRAWENYQRTGSKQHAAEYARARFRTGVITDEFLNA